MLGPDWAGPARFVGTIVGTLLIAGGALLVVRAVADLGTAVTLLPMPRDDAGLIETGAFGLVRHPIYGGLILAAFGWAIVQASIITIALAVLLAGSSPPKPPARKPGEEARFPGYAADRRRTPRFIPGSVDHPDELVDRVEHNGSSAMPSPHRVSRDASPKNAPIDELTGQTATDGQLVERQLSKLNAGHAGWVRVELVGTGMHRRRDDRRY